jgi:hypothetical protein
MNLTQEQQQMLAFAEAYKAVSSTPSGAFGHGPGGTFSYPGLSRFVFNAMILPHLGVQARLPLVISNETNPLYGIMTGVTATSGSQPSGRCDDFKTAGLMKLCMTSKPFGRYGLDTTVVNIDAVGEVTNMGETIDLSLLGNPVNNAAGRTGIAGVPLTGNPLRDEGAKRLFEFGASWAREYAPLLYSGNPTNNTAGGGYEEYHGFDSLINTGYRDAVTGIACPAADSILEDFNNQDISSSDGDIVGLIQDTFFRLRHIAAQAGLGGVSWVISMPLGMFYRLTEIWAYYYLTRSLGAMTFQSNVNVNVSGREAVVDRDTMRGDLTTRQGQFLMIDGQRVDVIIDDAITETEITPGKFAADIYIIPMTVLNGAQNVTFFNSFSFDSAPGRQAAIELARQFAPDGSYYTSDAGTFLWHNKPPTNYCVQKGALTKPRLVLRTPYIAARIQNVLWSPLSEHERSPFTDSAYFVNGGQTSYEGHFPSFYSPTT